MSIVLRSISLLDGKYTQVITIQDTFIKAMSRETMTKPNGTNPKVVLKRKVGYVDEEASVIWTKFAQMEITQMETMKMEIMKANENRGEAGSSVACNFGLSVPPS